MDVLTPILLGGHRIYAAVSCFEGMYQLENCRGHLSATAADFVSTSSLTSIPAPRRATINDRVSTLDLKQITYFTWVYEEENLSGAARRANVVQSAISMQIKRLEQELSARLFERESSGLRPTAAGEQLYSFCTSILREVAAAKEAVTGQQEGSRH